MNDLYAAKHGTATKYRNGCRCVDCKTSYSSAMKIKNARKLAATPADSLRHGTRAHYSIGCRCDKCKTAKKDNR